MDAKMKKVGTLDQHGLKAYALLDEASGRLWGGERESVPGEAENAKTFNSLQAAVNYAYSMGLDHCEGHQAPAIVEVPFSNSAKS